MWGAPVEIDIFPQEILLPMVDNAYRQSSMSTHYTLFPKIVFKSRLKKANILWNEEADSYIKTKKIFDYPHHRGLEIFDKVGGFVNVNIYSLYGTSFFTEEMKLNGF
ncbi:hypothetical protein [Bacillus sp. J33]|uniref:hypothetical protein n=1 Tax=Bacillus sp. J33 TaxID=935836 RepID=UPI00047E30D5|nr:hypothetical protein [Bacillus sp. J33]